MNNIRLQKIKLTNFKNVKNGSIEMPSFKKSEYFAHRGDILGIYGQNGSGKTALIDAVKIVKKLLTSESLDSNTVNYFSKDKDFSKIEISFAMNFQEHQKLVDYSVTFSKSQNDDFEISNENLSCSIIQDNELLEKITLLEYDNSNLLSPSDAYEKLISYNDNNINLLVCQKIAKKEKCSFIFSKDGLDIFTNINAATDSYRDIILNLSNYFKYNFSVISNTQNKTSLTYNGIKVNLDCPTLLSLEDYHIINNLMLKFNNIINKIIPDLTIETRDLGEELLYNSSRGKNIELVSIRNGITIPLKYESVGILKIVSMLNSLIQVYLNNNVCLFIDEIDSGVYEYLLGEILLVFENSAKGQLVFTSHNLRALEILEQENVIFSSANENNRYINLENQESDNLREVYLRSIMIGGQSEVVYNTTDTTEISRAFRKAGKVTAYEQY